MLQFHIYTYTMYTFTFLNNNKNNNSNKKIIVANKSCQNVDRGTIWDDASVVRNVKTRSPPLK